MNPVVGVVIFVAVIFWLVGIVYYFIYHSVKRKCTVMLKAEIVNINTDNDSIAIGHEDSIQYVANSARYPIYKYEYNGQTYETRASFQVWKNNTIGIGSKVDVYINPNDPKTLVTKDMEKLVIFKLLVAILIPIIIAIPLLCSIK